MKKLLLLLPLLAGLGAYDDFSLLPRTEELGELRWVLVDNPSTKSEMPDTNDFFLTIQDAKGNLLYEGTYGDSPAYLPVSPGAYTLKVVSIPFTVPAFERPQFGDEQVVVVPSGQTVTAHLLCTLLNAGLRFQPSSAFQEAFPGGELYVRQADTQLKYTYQEQRTGYFLADVVSAFLYHQGNEQTLFTRQLAPREVLTIRLEVSEPGSQVSISVDTTRNHTGEDYVLFGRMRIRNGARVWTNPEFSKSGGERDVRGIFPVYRHSAGLSSDPDRFFRRRSQNSGIKWYKPANG